MEPTYQPIILLAFLWSSGGCSGAPQVAKTQQVSAEDICENAYPQYRFIDTVVSMTRPEPLANFGPEKAFGPPKGAGDQSGSLDVFVIGEGESAIFQAKGVSIIDREGIDFKIFENGFFVQGNPQRRSWDLGLVAVSSDLIDWHAFPVVYDPGQDGFEENNTIGKKGFVGMEPVYANCETNPTDLAQADAGGDGFDLADIGVERARYIQIIDGGSSYPDGQIESNGVDIDAIAIFHFEEDQGSP